jgi:hypothetical protein
MQDQDVQDVIEAVIEVVGKSDYRSKVTWSLSAAHSS